MSCDTILNAAARKEFCSLGTPTEWMWFPNMDSVDLHFKADDLRALADELDRRNSPPKAVQEVFEVRLRCIEKEITTLNTSLKTVLTKLCSIKDIL